MDPKELAELIRDTTHNMDTAFLDDTTYCFHAIKRFLKVVEGMRGRAYKTCLDSKVRFEHWQKEGLIYRKDNIAAEDMPGGKHHCRCWAEPVPDVECIIENKSIDALRILELRVKLLELGIIFAQRGMHIQKQMIPSPIFK